MWRYGVLLASGVAAAGAARAYSTIEMGIPSDSQALSPASAVQAGVFPPLSSVPRTMRAVMWGMRAAMEYRWLMWQIPDKASQKYKDELHKLQERLAAKLYKVCAKNGGVYVKAAQFGSALQGVPDEYRRELEKLQDKAPPRPLWEVREVLKQEFGQDIEHLFATFSSEPAAAASLAQVHRATLPDGQPVAVKVQYLGLEQEVMADLAAVHTMSAMAQRVFPSYDLHWVFGEIARGLQRELDFLGEVHNAQLLAAACEDSGDTIAVPWAVPALCTRRVITMEWIDGCKINDVSCLRQQRLRPREVGLLLTDAVAAMTYDLGLVHQDPHAGNLLVRAAPDQGNWFTRWLRGGWLKPQIVFLDHGSYVHLPDLLRRQYCQLWCAFVLRDRKTAEQVAIAMAGERAGKVLPDVLRPRDWAAVPKEERKRLRREAGVKTFSDVSRLLEECPRPLVEVLRVSAMVRPIAALLGTDIHDRLRINATHAMHGMSRIREASGDVTFIGDLASRRKRWRLNLSIWLMRSAFWLYSKLEQLLVAVHLRSAH